MRYAGIIKNDIAAAPGVCLSFFTQGCPFRCTGCHNPETWDFDGGKELTEDVIKDIVESLNANGIERNFCIMGGEPLCPENAMVTEAVMAEVLRAYPDKKVYIWTGYRYEDLLERDDLGFILAYAYCLIDGQFIIEKRDVTLEMRGSSNQRIIYLDEK